MALLPMAPITMTTLTKVPGDLVVLSLGGAVPADCRLLGSKEIGVDQAEP